MARKSFAKRTRKTLRNKSTRRQKRRIRQRGGDMADVERYILGLDLGPTATPKEKITHCGAIVRLLSPQDIPILRLPAEQREAARRAFNDALEAIYAKHGVTDQEIIDEQYEVEIDLGTDEGPDIFDGIANNIYAEFLKVGAPVANTGMANRTRSKRPREGEELAEFEQVPPSKRGKNIVSLESTIQEAPRIKLSDNQEYTLDQIEDMWRFSKTQTPNRHQYTEEDKAKIMAFINFAKGGKKSRKTKKATKKATKKVRKTK